MPPTIDPEDTYVLVPRRDQKRPKDQRREFIFKHLNARQWKEAAAALELVDRAESAGAIIEQAIAGVAVALVDWRHVHGENETPLPFNRENIDLAMTDKDAVDLLVRMVAANGLTADQAKKFVLPWEFEEELSALIATAPSDARTDPTSESPSSSSARAATEPDAGTVANTVK